MVCTPVAPVPITATRLPTKLTGSCGHCAVWKDWPLNESTPSTRGMVGADSGPTAVIRNLRAVLAAVLQRHVPGPERIVVVRRGHAGAELDVAAQVELVGDVVDVAQRLGLSGEVLGPAPLLQQLLRERVLIGVALRIEARARIPVPIPGAADARAGLEHAHLEAELAQPVELVEAGHAGTDDDDVEVHGRRRPGAGACLLRGGHSLSLPECTRRCRRPAVRRRPPVTLSTEWNRVQSPFAAGPVCNSRWPDRTRAPIGGVVAGRRRRAQGGRGAPPPDRRPSPARAGDGRRRRRPGRSWSAA